MMQKSTMFFHYDFSCKKVLHTFTTILRVKKCHFHYDMQKKSLNCDILVKTRNYLMCKCNRNKYIKFNW
jgi:hypothetical protein